MNESRFLNGKKLFLTGGTGFFGKNLLQLLEQEHSTVEITLLSRNPERFDKTYSHFRNNLNITFLKGEIRSFSFPTETFDYIIHGATEADAVMIREQPQEMYSVIVDGTRHLLEFASRSPSARLLYLSSGAVYGPQPETIPFLPETYQGIPGNAYGKGKLEAEKLCLNSNTTCCIARCFAFSGAYLPLNKHYAIGNFVADALAQRPILIKGDGKTIRSYLDSRDLSRWLLTLLQNAPDREIFNIGSDRPISIRDLAEMVRNISGTPFPIIVQKEWNGCPPDRYLPDLSKAKSFGLQQLITLEQSIEEMLHPRLEDR